MPVNKAENSAQIECEDELRIETEAKSTADKANILLNQANKVIDAIGQHISYLKQEKDNA